MKIAVIFASRGLAFSETCAELLENLYGYNYEIFFAHGLPVADCFNVPLEKAMRKQFTHYFILEDDIILPPFTLTQMLAEAKPAVAVDYPVTKKGIGAVQYDSQGKALFTGTGCLLLEDSFLRKFKKPVFYTDVRWDIHVTKSGIELKKRKDKGETYGMHDVNFGLECYRRGKPIHVLKETIGQRKLKALGQVGTNQGQHDIELWQEVKSHPELIKLPTETQTSPLVAIKLKDGSTTNVSEETAKRLVEQKKGKRIIAKEVSFVK